MSRSVLDFNIVQPGCEASGAEPTLRMLVHQYYAAHFDEAKASSLANEYIGQIEYRIANKKV